MAHTFYTALWNMPGYLPDSDKPPPVFDSYDRAAEYLAYTLDESAMGYEAGDKNGNSFERMAAECRESTEADGFAMDGPDGYRYAVEETEARGRWTASDEHPDDDIGPYVVLTYAERFDGFSITAREAAEEVSTLCGSMVECPSGEGFAYVMVDSGKLAEAAGELRESGFELADSEGELVEED